MPLNDPGAITRQGQPLVVSITYNGQTSRVELPLGPEDQTVDEPARVSVTPTLGGAYAEALGTGIGTVMIAGSTGWRKTASNMPDGVGLARAIQQLHRYYENLTASSEPNLIEMRILLPPYPQRDQFTQEDWFKVGGYYKVIPVDLRVERRNSSPLLFRYRWTFTVLEDLIQGLVSASQRFRPGQNGEAPPAQQRTTQTGGGVVPRPHVLVAAQGTANESVGSLLSSVGVPVAFQQGVAEFNGTTLNVRPRATLVVPASAFDGVQL